MHRDEDDTDAADVDSVPNLQLRAQADAVSPTELDAAESLVPERMVRDEEPRNSLTLERSWAFRARLADVG